MSLVHAYCYAGPSGLVPAPGGGRCHLVADGEGLFRGLVRHPRKVALGLRALSSCVMTRYYMPPAMQELLLDPVVTVGRELLRFEGFSGCCSTYARLDLEEEAFAVTEARSRGTINVDFQAPMRAALAQVREDTPLWLEVGQEAVAIEAGNESVVERKVPFPMRWLRGLGEVQAYLARMEKRFEVSRAEAIRFLRSLPRTSRHVSYAEPHGRGLRLSQRKSKQGVPFTGTERLRLLEELLPHAESLTVYAEPFGASAWALRMGPGTFTLVLSPERWRGFSGEGQLLGSLATGDAEDVLGRVRACLEWQDRLDLEELAAQSGVEEDPLRDALALLAARGRVGFDLESGTWFHRELPFDLEQVLRMHPRLTNARKLVEAGAVQLRSGGSSPVQGTVRSGDVDYRVTLADEGGTCTCPWFAKHRGERGPCKHVLAVQIAAEEAQR